MNKAGRIIRNIFGMLIVLGATLLLINIIKDNWLTNVVAGTESEIEDWIDTFWKWSYIIAVISFGFAFVWYSFGQWILKLNDWHRAGKRWLWLILFLPPVFCAMIGLFFMPKAEEGKWLGNILLLFTAVVPFYGGTVLFSPSSYKYAPIGSKFTRIWW